MACGTGHLLDFIDPATYVGVDVSSGMLEQARLKHGGPQRTFVNAEAERMRRHIAHDVFDVACTFWSFSYFRDPQAVLRGMYAALRRGGRVCVHAYAPRYASRPSYLLGGQFPFRRYRPREIEVMLTGAGFHGVKAQPFRVAGDRLAERLPCGPLKRLMRWEMESLPPALGMTYVLTGEK